MEDLLFVQWLRAAIPFDYPNLGALNLLVRRVTEAASHAFPASTNASPVFGGTRINYFVFEHAALGAIHCVVLANRQIPDLTQPVVWVKLNFIWFCRVGQVFFNVIPLLFNHHQRRFNNLLSASLRLGRLWGERRRCSL